MAKLSQIFVITIVAVFMVVMFTPTNGATIHRKRSTATTCDTNSPCGWAIYRPFTREVDYFMKNTCVCAEPNECVRVTDDIQVSAFVYMCRIPSDRS